MITPVVFFAFNRPDTTQRVLDALKDQTIRPPLIIAFADGVRYDAEAPRVEAVRRLIRAIDWTDIQLIERERNYGGPANLIQGVSQVFESYDRAVIVEDDILPAGHFYEVLCMLLDQYQSSSHVFSVSGYPSLLKDALPHYPYDVILSPRFSIWGWGTWTNRWRQVQSQLYNFKNPFPNPESVPQHAGADLCHMAREAENGTHEFFWMGAALALLALYNNWLHAMTKHYLVKNIGLNIGQHADKRADTPKLTAFYELHNVLIDKVPQRFPAAAPHSDVFAAVQEYMKTVAKLDKKKAPRSRWRKWSDRI